MIEDPGGYLPRLPTAKRMLVMDDNKRLTESLHRRLQYAGYDLDGTAPRASDALTSLSSPLASKPATRSGLAGRGA
jgi:hypothetical protein